MNLKFRHYLLGAFVSSLLVVVCSWLLIKNQQQPKQLNSGTAIDKVIIIEPPCLNCIYVTKTDELNEQNNPILKVEVFDEHSKVTDFKALSGRAWAQEYDRNIADNSSPSPKGTYTILPETVGIKAETGGVFRPYEPNFETQRSALGFHVDPSWGLDNEEDGTTGCIALKTLEEYNHLNTLINNIEISDLIIDY